MERQVDSLPLLYHTQEVVFEILSVCFSCCFVFLFLCFLCLSTELHFRSALTHPAMFWFIYHVFYILCRSTGWNEHCAKCGALIFSFLETINAHAHCPQIRLISLCVHQEWATWAFGFFFLLTSLLCSAASWHFSHRHTKNSLLCLVTPRYSVWTS